MTRQTFAFMVALFSFGPAIADDMFTSPQTIVNATIEPSRSGGHMVFTGALLYFETVQSAYHVEMQRDQPSLANRSQDVALLQSKLVIFNVRQLKFRTVNGDDIDVEKAKERLKENPLALILPGGAKIHPQLAAALNPDTIVVSRAGRSKLQRLVPRPDGG
ncbi:hypothetical protein [Roseimaritima sediminicola]|uniref:hypothetical protein n=1 Tax=Roseimaritima sediminicola TaxID=2662066 RepID=UPI0012984556|nr:hypothetical protein [Roseimaritima sediminicola]